MGPLSSSRRRDLAAIAQAAGPLGSAALADLARVIRLLTAATPPVLSRQGLTSDEAISAVMAVAALDHAPPEKRLPLALELLRALDLNAPMALALWRYAEAPETPRTVLHALLPALLGAASAAATIDAVLRALASGEVKANANGAQVYAFDDMLWLMAHPRTLAIALREPDASAIDAAYAPLREAGLASAVMPVIIRAPQGRVRLYGFWSRADVWRDYAAASGILLNLNEMRQSEERIQGEPRLDVAPDLFG